MELMVKIQSRKGHIRIKGWIHPLIIIDEGSGGDRELRGMICSNPSSGVVILGQGESQANSCMENERTCDMLLQHNAKLPENGASAVEKY